MFNNNDIKLGIAPIGWTNDDMPELGAENSFEQCISEIALSGFVGTEIGNKFPKDATILKNALKLRKIEIASAWFSSYLTIEHYEETEKKFIKHRDFLFEMGAKIIVVCEQGHSIQKLDKPLFEEKPYFSSDEWNKLAEGLNKLGMLAKEKNMKIVYHHHMGTGVQTLNEIDRLMEITDENLVYLLLDTGHLYLSDENPVHVLKKYLSRIKHVHLKDVRDEVKTEVLEHKLSFLDGVRKGMFTVPGDGNYDFKEVFDILKSSGYKGWLIVEAEQDPKFANPFEYALKARKYLKEIAGL